MFVPLGLVLSSDTVTPKYHLYLPHPLAIINSCSHVRSRQQSPSNGCHVGTISDEFDRNQLAGERMTRSYHLSRCVSPQYIATTGASSSRIRPLQWDSDMQDSWIQVERDHRTHNAQLAGSLLSGTFAHNSWSLRQQFNC